MEHTSLTDWGATDRILTLIPDSESDLDLARISAQARGQYRAVTECGERDVVVSGRFMFDADDPLVYPAVGDWVLLAGDDSLGVIQRILPRTALLARKSAGRSTDAQLIAANVDVVFICMAMNEDYNLRRLERYLAVVWESGATPVIVLTKADLATDLSRQFAEVERIVMGAETIVTASLQGEGLEEVRRHVGPGITIAFIGSSGVGKSTLVNTLAGREILKTSGLRNDGQGRHTTTHRQAILLPEGGILIDTPGMRELGLDSADVGRTFEDITELESQCRFADCTHASEPGCAVRDAVESGELDPKRLESYRKLEREARYSGMSSREIGNDQINRMFGGKAGLKALRRDFKARPKNRP